MTATNLMTLTLTKTTTMTIAVALAMRIARAMAPAMATITVVSYLRTRLMWRTLAINNIVGQVKAVGLGIVVAAVVRIWTNI